jgi:hypothetical protein
MAYSLHQTQSHAGGELMTLRSIVQLRIVSVLTTKPSLFSNQNSFIYFPPTYVSRSTFGFDLTSNEGVTLVKFFLRTNMQIIDALQR